VLTKYYLGDHIENEMGGTCSRYVRGEVHTVFDREMRERDHCEDLGVVGRIILKWIFTEARTRLMWLKIGTDDGLL
jgi:hypothetical protein